MTDDTPRPKKPDDELIQAVLDALADGERDRLGGGIRPATVARRVDRPVPTIKMRLHQLAERGELAKVWGGSPETLTPRTSYLPPDHEDAPGNGLADWTPRSQA